MKAQIDAGAEPDAYEPSAVLTKDCVVTTAPANPKSARADHEVQLKLRQIVADHEAQLAWLRELVAAVHENRFAAILSLINLKVAKALTDFRSNAGKASGKKRANKDWHRAAKKLAVTALEADPKLQRADLIGKIKTAIKPPVEDNAIWSYVRKMIDSGTITLLEK